MKKCSARKHGARDIEPSNRVLMLSLTDKAFSDINQTKIINKAFMNKTYHIFGLNLESDISLPMPTIADPPAGLSPDVIIEFDEVPSELANPRSKGVHYQAGPGEFLLRVDSVASYYVREGRRITIQPFPGAEEERILVFLLGSAMGALLHQRNILVLHAGAIAVNRWSVLFTGHSGAGKSTLAAGFHKRGYPFLADDICAIAMLDGWPAVVPGFPRLKLWADVLKKLDKDKDQLKSVRWHNDLEKYFMPIEGIQMSPVPLKSIFVLGTADTDIIEITALKGGEKIYPIINNTYRLRFLEGLGGKKDHFTQCAAVAAKTSVYRTVRPGKGFLLNELMDMMEAKFLS
jgi:hypothetical protein